MKIRYFGEFFYLVTSKTQEVCWPSLRENSSALWKTFSTGKYFPAIFVENIFHCFCRKIFSTIFRSLERWCWTTKIWAFQLIITMTILMLIIIWVWWFYSNTDFLPNSMRDFAQKQIFKSYQHNYYHLSLGIIIIPIIIWVWWLCIKSANSFIRRFVFWKKIITISIVFINHWNYVLIWCKVTKLRW